MQSLADKRLVRRLATYIVGGGLTMALLVLATAATVGLVVTGAAQGYDAGGTLGAGTGAGAGAGAGSGAAGGTLGAGTVNPNTGVGMLLYTALFFVLAGVVALAVTKILSQRRQSQQ
jgi:hypothetical protein